MTERTHEPFIASNGLTVGYDGALGPANGVWWMNAEATRKARQYFLEEFGHEGEGVSVYPLTDHEIIARYIEGAVTIIMRRDDVSYPEAEARARDEFDAWRFVHDARLIHTGIGIAREAAAQHE